MLLEKGFFFCDVDCLCGHFSVEGGKRGNFLVKIIIRKVIVCLASKKQIYRSEGLGSYKKKF